MEYETKKDKIIVVILILLAGIIIGTLAAKLASAQTVYKSEDITATQDPETYYSYLHSVRFTYDTIISRAYIVGDDSYIVSAGPGAVSISVNDQNEEQQAFFQLGGGEGEIDENGVMYYDLSDSDVPAGVYDFVMENAGLDPPPVTFYLQGTYAESMFVFPVTSIGSLMGSVSSVFGNTWIVVVVAIAIPLAFIVIGKIKKLFIGK